MKKYLKTIHQAILFKGVPIDDFDNLLTRLDSQLKFYTKDQTIIKKGIHLKRAGILIEGHLRINAENFWGPQNKIGEISIGHLFGEEFACSRSSVSNISVTTDVPSVVLWFNIREILKLDVDYHYNTILIRNLMNEMASKAVMQNEQLTHMSKKTTKEKIMSYLSDEAAKAGTNEFDIPYSRQELADYLHVERTAMSTVITELKNENMLITKRNHFILLKKSCEIKKITGGDRY